VCIDIPLGTAFQYRCTGHVPLVFTCTALPPWPGDHEAVIMDGPWVPRADLELGASGSDQPPQHAEILADDDAEVLEPHPVDALVNGRDELDARDRSPIEDIERLGEHGQGDRTPVPYALAVRSRMALEKRSLVDVQIPLGDADGEGLSGWDAMSMRGQGDGRAASPRRLDSPR
jgi:hypothetical protein